MKNSSDYSPTDPEFDFIHHSLHKETNYRYILMSLNKKGDSFDLPIILGRNIGGIAQIDDLRTMRHLLIIGENSKTIDNFVGTTLSTLVTIHNPHGLRLVFIDKPIHRESEFGLVPHCIHIPEADHMSGFQWILNEMDARYKVFSHFLVKNVEEYVAGCFHGPISHNAPEILLVVIVIDDLANILANAESKESIALIQIARLGPAVGMHLIGVTRQPEWVLKSESILANLLSRIVFRISDSEISDRVLGYTGAAKLYGAHDFLFRTFYRDLEWFQATMISDIDKSLLLTDFGTTQQNPFPDLNQWLKGQRIVSD